MAQWLNLVRSNRSRWPPGAPSRHWPHPALARAMLIAPPSSGCHNRSTGAGFIRD